MTGDYLWRMEDVLHQYQLPADSRRPLLCFDERPCFLIAYVGGLLPMSPGKAKCYHYEYQKNGSCCVFLAFEPHTGFRYKEFRMDMLRLFYDCDEFCREFVRHLQTYQSAEGEKSRLRHSTLSVSEGMTILILFHTSGFRNLKTFYLHHICLHLTRAFPQRVSYSRFVELEAEALLPLAAFLTTRLGRCTGLSFIDSTPLKVCHNLRIKSHKVFKEIAQRGVSSTGWFYGFKVHLVISDCGDLLAVRVRPGSS